MLAFRRKKNEKIYINDGEIVIEILGIDMANGIGTVRLGIEAPKSVGIARGEHWETPETETKRSAESDFEMRDLVLLLDKKREEHEARVQDQEKWARAKAAKKVAYERKRAEIELKKELEKMER